MRKDDDILKHARLTGEKGTLHIQFFAESEVSGALAHSGKGEATEGGAKGEAGHGSVLTSVCESAAKTSLSEWKESEKAKESKASVPEPLSTRRSRLTLIFMLIVTLVSAVAVIVYGVLLSGAFRSSGVPFTERVLSEVFGSGITALDGSYARVPLKRLPSQTVGDGDEPGAAEFESVGDGEDGDSDEQTDFSVVAVDLSVKKDNVFALINETPYSPDVDALYSSPLVTPTVAEIEEKYGEGAPAVLILHTHGTESYLPEGAAVYGEDETFRSYNMEKNVLAVGRKMAEKLESEGIGVVHLSEMFDAGDYNSAYYLASKEIARVLGEYPSISYVFDVHRDAMNAKSGAALKPVSQIASGGVYPAQLMLVVGTDHAGASHAEWEDNLSLALKLQASAAGINETIMRGINLRSASFNAQLCKGAMIVEVGAAANSLSEATAAAEIFAEAVAKVIKG